jgi:hypothetical protein
MKPADHRDVFKKASKSVSTSTIVVSPDVLSPTPAASAAMKAPDPQSRSLSTSLVENEETPGKKIKGC